jgi:hypothetical protein
VDIFGHGSNLFNYDQSKNKIKERTGNKKEFLSQKEIG